jgi:hypothetical protein
VAITTPIAICSWVSFAFLRPSPSLAPIIQGKPGEVIMSSRVNVYRRKPRKRHLGSFPGLGQIVRRLLYSLLEQPMTDDIFHPSGSKWRRTCDSLSLLVVSIRLEPLNASVLGGTGAAILCSAFTNGSSNRDHAIRTPPSTPSGGTSSVNGSTYLLQCARLFFDGTNSSPFTGFNKSNRPVPILSHPDPVLYLLILLLCWTIGNLQYRPWRWFDFYIFGQTTR